MFSFRELRKDDADQILEWRTNSLVTEFMTTDIKKDSEAQKTWIESSFQRKDYYHWVIRIDKQDVGLLNIVDIDLDKRTISWGYYLGESEFMGIGAMIPPFLYNFVFTKWPIEKIIVEVFETNQKVVSIHLFHGYVRNFSSDRYIEKNGTQIKLLTLSLSAQDWLKKETFHKCIAEFPISKWVASPFLS